MADRNERAWAAEQTARTRRQLILAGMRRMADDGIDGVSLRSVNTAAGAKNSSAAHYHFGSKLGLIEAIVDTLTEDVMVARQPRMNALRERAESETLTAREIIDAAYLPFFGLFYHPDYGVRGIKFLSRLIVDTAPDMRVVVNRFTTPLAEEVYELLVDALPDVPPRLLKARILFSLINLINGSSDAFSLSYSPFGDLSYENPLELANDFLDYLVTAISAPPTAPPTEDFVALCGELIAEFQSAGDAAEDLPPGAAEVE